MDDCYEKLDDLISKNDFTKIAYIILKLLNDIDENDKDDDKLFNEIKKIISNISNKESIIMMCLSILSSKYLLNNKLVKNSKKVEIQEKKDEISEIVNLSNSNFEYNNFYEINEEIEEKIEGEKRQNEVVITLINGMENFKDEHYSFGKHYYNNNNQIYCFFPTKNKFANKLTLYCCRRYDKCKATCVVDKKSQNAKITGTHNHNQGISNLSFYNQYPCLTNKEWEHIQIFKGENKVIIVIQS